MAAHTGTPSDAQKAVRAGVDDINHRPQVSDEVLEEMVARGVYWVPTYEVGGSATATVREFVAAGGQLTVGNDSAYLGSTVGMPLIELMMMRDEGGLTPLELITAATRNGAHVCNLEQELGTLEVGKIADVLVVNGDPLADPKTLRDVRLVVHGGVVIREEWADWTCGTSSASVFARRIGGRASCSSFCSY